MEAPSFYVVSHERAGTHFTINTLLKNTVGIARQANIGEWFGPYRDGGARFAHIDQACRSIQDTGTLIKSHCDADLFAARYPARPVLWVVRDPRDTLISWFHYLNREAYYANNPQVERFQGGRFGDFLRRPLTEFLRYSYSLHGDFTNVAERWAAHTQSWVRSGLPLCVVRYEELQHDFEPTLRRVAEFLGLQLRPKLAPVAFGEGLSHLPRKGIVGDWQNEAAGEDLRWLDEIIRSYDLTEFYHSAETTKPSSQPPNHLPPPPRRLLLLRPDAYGDLVLFEPSLRRLRQAWPQTEIAVLIRSRVADIVPVLDPAGSVRWLTTDCDPYRQAPGDCRPELDALAEAVRSFVPDCVVAACASQTWLESAVAALFPEARRVSLGPGLTDPLVRAALEAVLPVDWAALYPERVSVEPTAREWENNQRLVSALVGEAPAWWPVAHVPAASRAAADQILAGAGMLAGEFVICAAAGMANVPIKTWPAANYGEVLAWLQKERGMRALLIGHVSERDHLEAVRSAARAHGGEPALWTGRDGEMPVVAALLASARFYFGNDTGALHLAAALGRPVVAVFGGGTWPRFQPVAARSLTVVQPLPCFGCAWDCYYADAPCVRTISPVSVCQALDRFLEGGKEGQTVFEAEDLGAQARSLIDAATPRLRFSRADSLDRLRQMHELTLQTNNLQARLRTSDVDRTDRLRQIEELTALLIESEADRAARLRNMEKLTALLEISEADRAARLRNMEELTALLKACEANLPPSSSAPEQRDADGQSSLS